jgi:D-sedoheptulose 7-phosphate isomerase
VQLASEDNKRSQAFAVRRKLLEWTEQQVPNNVRAIADALTRSLSDGGTVYACGNGGSASQAEHFVAELAGRFKMDRKALAAVALSTNASTVTAVSNDYGFSQLFARQLDGLAKEGDCLVAISTSGSSENVVNACRVGRKAGMKVFGLTGGAAGAISADSDVVLMVPDNDTARIQEIHLIVLHLICQMVETNIFSAPTTRPQNV